MNGHVIRSFIFKDWRMHIPIISLSIVGGVLALAIFELGGPTAFVIGGALFFISMGFSASYFPVSNIVNERKNKTLPFLMSFPISSAQYGVAKLASTVGMFLVPWLTLIAAALWMILGYHALPHGAIPLALMLANFPFIGFCLITGTALVGESERWGTAAVAFVNSTYWLAWYFLIRDPALTRTWNSPVVVWNSAALDVLAAQFILIAVILGLTLYIQSRRRDLV
jgi:ABC-2 type transport system permease protein